MAESFRGNPGELWRTLNEITSRRNVSPPSFIQSNGCQVTNPKLIACLLSDHIVTVGSKLSSKFQTVCSALGKILPSASKQNAQSNDFSFTPVSESFVFKQLKTLKTNKAIGLDKISSRLLKDSAESIAPVLTRLFNRSLDSSVFPAFPFDTFQI